MSLVQLKDQAAQLGVEEQRELIAFLVAGQLQGDDTFQRELAAKIDDADLARWIELDDLRERYAD